MSTGWVGLAGVVAASLVAAAPQEPTADSRLDGVWVLNADESDDARDKLQEAMRERFRGRRPGRGGPGGGPGGGFPGGGPGFPGEGSRRFPGGPGGDGAPPGGPEARLEDFERLEITSAPREIQIAYGERLRIYRPDGREVERRSDEGLAKVKAHWEDGRLVIESDGERAKTREVFELDGDRLVLTQLIDGRVGQVKIRRVYDRGAAEEGPKRSESESEPDDS